MANKQIEIEATEALLDVGVSVPFKDIHIPFRKKPIRLRISMHRPYLSTQIRIAREYLKMGMSYDEVQGLDKDGQMKFLAEHGKRVSKMVALTMCRGPISARLFGSVIAWLLRNFVEDRYLQAAYLYFVCLLGTQNFTNIIKSVEMTNPMKIRLRKSQRKKGS